MAVSVSTIKAAFDALDAQAQSTEMSASDYNQERSQIIADAILSAEIDELTTTANGVTIGGASVPVTGGLK